LDGIRWTNIPPTDFISANPDGVIVRSLASVFNTGATPVEALLGPFNIPHGAVIKSFKVDVTNTTNFPADPEVMVYRLWRFELGSASPATPLAEIISDGTGTLSVPVPAGPPVDNERYAYQVEIVQPVGLIPDIGFEVHLAALAYEIPPPAPPAP
jgi:hypothetical protein